MELYMFVKRDSAHVDFNTTHIWTPWRSKGNRSGAQHSAISPRMVLPLSRKSVLLGLFIINFSNLVIKIREYRSKAHNFRLHKDICKIFFRFEMIRNLLWDINTDDIGCQILDA